MNMSKMVAAVVLLVGTLIGGCHDRKEVRVGVLSFMTGTYAQMGHDFVNGILMAQDECNQQTREFGVGVSFDVMVEDGKAEAKTSLTAMNRLLFKGVDTVIIAGDNQVPVVAPLVVRSKLPSIATIVSNSKLLEYNSAEPWIFKNCTSIGTESDTIARYGVNELALKRIAVFKMRSEFGEESASAFIAACNRLKASVTDVETFDEAGADFKSIVAKAVGGHPDAVFVSGYGVAYSTILNQVREAGFAGVVLTVNSIINPETQKIVKNYGDMYYASFVKPMTKAYVDFENRYSRRYASAPSIYSAYGYDSFKILAEAVASSRRKDTSVRAELASVHDFQILMGKISFKDNGDAIIPLAVNKMNADGTAVIISQNY